MPKEVMHGVESSVLRQATGRLVLWFLLLIRVIAMVVVPLNDSTEARYGEMARKMLVTHDWITLWHEFGVPFWGKPPLSIWLAAFSIKLFGVNEWALRLPALCLSLGIIWMIWRVVANERGRVVADMTVVILSSTFLFYLAAGTIMTDPALVFGLVLCQVAFWHSIHTSSKSYGYLFFLGIAIGLLSKGPIILVLVAGFLFVWNVLERQWSATWNKLPWISGSLLTAVLVIPWYVLAEIKTPGFLRYFIIGEHLGRFLQSSWEGDKYGFAHAQIWGKIWLYALMGLMPWTVWLIWGMIHSKTRNQVVTLFRQDKSGWLRYWLIAFLFPCVFFTFSSNLIYPYVLPSVPAFAILFAEGWVINRVNHLLLLRTASVVGIGFLIGVGLFILTPQWVVKSEKQMIAVWQTQPDHQANPLIYFDNRLEFSAEFYSRHHAINGITLQTICPELDQSKVAYFVVAEHQLTNFTQTIHRPFQIIRKVLRMGSTMDLIRVKPPVCSSD